MYISKIRITIGVNDTPKPKYEFSSKTKDKIFWFKKGWHNFQKEIISKFGLNQDQKDKSLPSL